MSEMIERVARAIYAAMREHGDEDIRAGLAWIDMVPVARAAIEAMREPTSSMIHAGWDHEDSRRPSETWRAMVDDALT